MPPNEVTIVVRSEDETKAGVDSAKKGALDLKQVLQTSLGVAGGQALLGLGRRALEFGRNFVTAAEESQQVAAQTTAALRSTGGAANVTAGEISALSEALSEKAGIDDEVIQSGANLLLTFTRVRNEVGAGNDIFDQAAAAALDMSVAMGTDLTSATTMLGKALNDPIAGITAMTRAGVQFTQQQKDQIRALVESGDILGAQKIILEELTTQFGGSAEAQATATGRMSVAWGNLQEAIGEKVLPAVEDFADFVTDTGIPVGEKLADVLGVLVPDGAGIAVFGLAALTGAAIFLLPRLAATKEAAESLGLSLKGLGATAGPLGLVVGAIGLIGEVGSRLNRPKSDIDELTNALLDFAEGGRVAGELSKLAGADLETLGDAFRSIVDTSGMDEFNNAWGSFVDGMTLGKVDTPLQEARNRINDLDEALTALAEHDPELAAEVFRRLTAELEQQGLSAGDVRSQLDGYVGTLDEAATSERIAEEGAVGLDEALLGVTGSTDDAEQALSDFEAALHGLFDPLFGFQDALNGVIDANIKIAEAEQALADARAEHGATSEEAIQAERDLAEAHIEAGEAALDVEVAARQLNAAVADGTVDLDQARAMLDRWVAQGTISQETANRLAAGFDRAADQADRLEGVRQVTITESGVEVVRQKLERLNAWIAQVDGVHHVDIRGNIQGTIRPRGAQAHGGITGAQGGGPRSDLTLVGEQGFELLDLPPGTQVHSNPDSERILSGMGGGGDVHVTVNVQGSILSERDLMGLIRDEFERGGFRGLVGVG